MKQVIVTADSLKKMCRLCLMHGVSMTGIFGFSLKSGKEIADIIMSCAPVQITKHNEMPACICQVCYNKLEEMHEFQRLIVQSERILKHYIQHLHSAEKQMKNESSSQSSSDDFGNQNSPHGVDIIVKCEPLETNDAFGNQSSPPGLDIIVKCEPLETNDAFGNQNSPPELDIIVKCEPLETSDAFDTDISHRNIELPETPNILSDKNKELPVILEKVFNVRVKEESTIPLNLSDSESPTGDKHINKNTKKDFDAAKLSSVCPPSVEYKNKNEFSGKLENFNEKHSVNSNILNDVNDFQEVYNVQFKEEPCDALNVNNRNSECPVGSEIASENTKIDIGDTNLTLERFRFCQDKNGNECPDKLTDDKKKPLINKKLHECSICKKGFRDLNGLKSHKLIHTGEKPYQCDVCKMCFRHSNSLKSHVLTHTGEKPYQCDICKMCFRQPTSFRNHKLIHTGEKPYQCDICRMCFRHLTSLKSHKLEHTGEKPYQCDVCKMFFSRLGNLNRHKLTHTGEKLFKCEVCKMCFRHSSSLKSHTLKHTGEKPYHCDVCNMCFKQSGSLKTHKLTHTGEKPYQCDVCKMNFRHSNSLKNHKLEHTGEKPHQCDVCNMSFKQSCNLKTHKLKHTGEKPYQCDVCKMCFRHSNSLKCHKFKHTGSKPYQL